MDQKCADLRAHLPDTGDPETWARVVLGRRGRAPSRSAESNSDWFSLTDHGFAAGLKVCCQGAEGK